jgi:membrane-associated phospholipid phosphatase
MPYSLLVLLLLSRNAADQNSVTEQTSAPEKAQKSAIAVQPGAEVIKSKDLWTESGYVHPFTRMPRYILQDQKAIWTSPFHTAKSDIKFWAIFGAATAGLIAADRHIVQQLPNSPTQVSVSTWGSRFGAAYTLIPVSAGFYFIGSGEHNDRLRETGLLSFESLIDSTLVVEAVKLAADRARPYQTDGSGHFESSPSGRWSSGFPSGHAINVWTVASVVAHEYPHPRYIPIIAYGLATTVVVARVGARQHFPGDVLAGSAMGWFIGDYTYARRHNPALDQKPSVAGRVLDHVHFNFALQ